MMALPRAQVAMASKARAIYAQSLWNLPNDGWALYGQIKVPRAGALTADLRGARVNWLAPRL